MSLFSPSFTCGAKIDKCIYASAYKYNALIKVDIHDGRTEYMSSFPNSDLVMENQHSRAYVYNNKVFFSPAMGDYIHIFNPELNDIKSVIVDRNNYRGEYYGLMYKKSIILCPKMVGGDILCFNMDTMEFQTMVKWEKIKHYICGNPKYVFLRVTQVDDSLYLPIYNTSIMLILDIDSLVIQKTEIRIDKMLGAYGGKNGIYFFENDSPSVYKWNQISNVIEKCVISKEFEKDNFYTFAIELYEKTYLFPSCSFPYIGSVQDGRIEPVLKMDDVKGKMFFLEPFYSDNKIWALPFQGESMLCISKEEVALKKLKSIKIDNIAKKLIEKNKASSKKMFYEGDDLSIYEFIESILSAKKRE